MDTIVALSTALAKSAISIVRLSGNDALAIVSKLLTPLRDDVHLLLNDSKCSPTQPDNIKQVCTSSIKPLLPRKATLRCIYDEYGRMLDKVILIYFQAPFSFNGEDIVEIQSHGGLLIAQEILKTCIHFGAMLAKPGEFSKRALLNGKLDLIELEATIALINNTNTNLRQLLTKNLDGKCTQILESIRLQILEIIAQIEVNIDYSQEDLDPSILEQSLYTLTTIISRFKAILESTKQYNRLQNIKLCILGKPNVGKSSLLNLLLMKERAIVSDIAGTTRDAITEVIDIYGNPVVIADTAGIRQSNNEIEAQGIQRSFEYAKESEILLCVFDLSSEMTKDDETILEFIQNQMQHKSILIILNKNDLQRKNYYDFSHFEVLEMNTKDESNTYKLKDKIQTFLTMEINQDTLILTSSMQSQLLESSLISLKEAVRLLDCGEIELASFELQQSLQSLGAITKPYNVEEVLDSMFSQFCVGK